jgi:hypothetical protein
MKSAIAFNIRPLLTSHVTTMLPCLFCMVWKPLEMLGSCCVGLVQQKGLSNRGLRVKSLILCGAQGRDRTTDTRIFSPLLYQLSYLGL